MVEKARQYKPSTIRRLDILSGNQCYNPDCNKPLLARDKQSIISKISHIEAAGADGPRYNPNMDDDERRSFENLLLLCDECHITVDNKNNVDEYPVKLLKEWKKIHESQQIFEHIKNPQLLRMAVDAISEARLDKINPKEPPKRPFNPADKISFNCLRRNKSLIEEYRVYHSKINSLYQELEKQGSFKKERLLRNIETIYLKILGNYVLDSKRKMEIIRENADNIIEDIEQELFNLISDKFKDSIFEISVIMVDAFIRCKILEDPNDTR